MKYLIVIVSVLTPFLIFAQKKDKTLLKISNTIMAADLKRHLYIVASAEMEGRDTPSPGLEKAADYIEAHFRSLGLLPGNNGSYRQPYPMYSDSLLASSLKVNGKEFELNRDFQPQTSVNHSAEMAFSEFVFAGYGITDSTLDNYKNLDVAGKLVLILDGTPEGYTPSGRGFSSPSATFGKINTARKNGAAALLIVSKNFPRNSMPAAGGWNLNYYRPAAYPLVFTISENLAETLMGADGRNILTSMKEKKLSPQKYTADVDLSFFKTTRKTTADNVLGVIEGTDKKEEWIVITAHYDHVGKRNDTTIFYGADDDGSGTVTILELAEAFAKAKAEGKGPRRSILFMTVSGEEHGLWGSAYYTDHPVYPLEKTSANLNIDMIGRIGNDYLKDKDSLNYVYIIGDNKLSSELTPITDRVNGMYTKLKLDRKYNDPNDPNRFYYRSDHYNFAEKGVPIIFYFNGVHKDYHRPTDTPDKISYELLARRAKLVFFTAWEMANRDEMIKRDIPLN